MPNPTPRSKPRRAARAALGLAVSAATLVVCLVLLEAGLRLATLGSLKGPRYSYYLQLFVPHPTRGWALAPNSSAWLRTPDFSVLHATNSRGFRDVEHAFEKPPGVYRVVVLGDSFMEAGQVHLEESFSRLLEAQLTGVAAERVEVINLGCSGYGQVQELLALREEGLRYDPDLVLLAFLPENDLCNNHPALERLMGWFPNSPFARFGADGELEIYYEQGGAGFMDMQRQAEHLARKDSRRPFWERTMLFDRWQRAFGPGGDAGARSARDPNVWLGAFATRFEPGLGMAPADTDWERIWSEARASLGPLLAAMRASAEEVGADFLVFTVPGPAQVDPAYAELLRAEFPALELDFEGINAFVQDVGRDVGVEVLDLLPAFRAARAEGRAPLHHPEDRHWNAAGHRLAARAVAEHLRATRFRD